MHPDWGKSWDYPTSRYDGDIAIVKFEAIQLSSYVNQICLPQLGENVYGLEGTIFGYGYANVEAREPENIPRFVQIGSIDLLTCLFSDPSYVKLASNRSFCAGEVGKIPCIGLRFLF
jgi:hypothetical protein